MNNKKISIITVCKNAEKTIAKTINSINNQTYKNIEHIIIDGNSEDETYKIAKNTKILPGLIKSEKDTSAEDAMNKSIKFSTGEIIFFLNADDILANKNIIDKIMKKFDKFTDIVFGNIEYFDHLKNKLTGRKFIPGEYIYGSYLNGWHAPHPAFIVKKKCYEKFGVFREDIKVSPDFELMFRFQELKKLKSAYLNETITFMGVGGNSGSFKNILIGNFYVVKSLLGHNQKFFILLFLFKRLMPKIINKLLLTLKLTK